MTSRHLAIGDIHGCLDALRTLADHVGFTQDDTIITLGDYVDRGPDSRGVIEWLLALDQAFELVPLRGNHEIMMLESRTQYACLRDWLPAGGKQTLASYAEKPGAAGNLKSVPDRHWGFLSERLFAHYETGSHLFVHANAYPDTSLEDQPDYMLYWEKLAPNAPRHESGKIMVCGHTSQRSGLPMYNGNVVCIDTYAYGGGWLSCLDAASGRIWQANQKRETRELWLDELREENP